MTGCELQILRATMWLQVEEVATTEFYWLKKCALHFQTSVGSSHSLKEPIRNFDMFSDGQVRMKDHVLVSKFQIFDHPLADVLDEIIFLRLLGNVIVRKRSVGCFFGK